MKLTPTLLSPWLLLLTLLPLSLCAQLPEREYRAVWFTTLNGLDWPSTRATTDRGILSQQEELRSAFDCLQAAGINTILFQTRIRGTVAYPSAIEPWDGAFTGTPGRSPGYDPLRFALDEAHRRGMELHAWVVAFPICKVAAMRALGNQALPKKRPELCQRTGDQYMMDPGVPATGDYLADICREIAEKYDVDGIHLDYIRYPERSVSFDDSKTFRRYGAGQPLQDWRRANVTAVVRKIHAAVKQVRPWLKLSCSPVGKYADLPRQSSRGWNARDVVCQEAAEWLNEGLMDVLFPMMYFDGEHFYPFAQDWKERCPGRQVAPGLGIYFLHPREKNWSLPTVQRQLGFIRDMGLSGYAFFRSRFLTDDTKGLYSWTRHSFNAHPALPPAANATDSIAPPRPAVSARRGSFSLHLQWPKCHDDTGAPVTYNVYRLAGDTFLPLSMKQAATEFTFRPALPASLGSPLAVTSIDAFGNESEPCIVAPVY